MNTDKLNNSEHNSEKQVVLDVYSKIIKFLRGAGPNSPYGRSDDEGRYKNEYYDSKDVRDQINDMMQAAKQFVDEVQTKDEYLKKLGAKLNLYQGGVKENILKFIESEFSVKIKMLSEDDFEKKKYETRMYALTLFYVASVEDVKKLISYEDYLKPSMTIEKMHDLMVAKFQKRDNV